MELLAVIAAVAVIWILAKRSSVSTPAASKQPNELDQLNEQQLRPPEGSYAGSGANYGDYSGYTGRTSTELDAIDPAADPGSLADYQPPLDPAYPASWGIELPLTSPRPN